MSDFDDNEVTAWFQKGSNIAQRLIKFRSGMKNI